MRYIEAPEIYVPEQVPNPTVFLAGGITGCPDWQDQMVWMLANENVTLFNPRRTNFPISDPNAAEAQITWEHNHLKAADAILFWFPKESICPIALYELGAWTYQDKPIWVGAHPEYPRRQDVVIQTRLARPDVPVAYDLHELADEVSWSLGALRNGGKR